MSTQRGNGGTAVLLVVLAVVALVGGMYIGFSPPRCNGETMSPGDRCYTYGRGTQSYAEAARTAQWAPVAGGVLAVLLVGAAVREMSPATDRRTPAAASPAAGGAGSAGGTRSAGGVASAGGTKSAGGAGSAGGTGSVDAIPLARTPAESHLAMSLSPCSCGAADVPTEHALFHVDGTYVGRHSGTCRCGKPRDFLFRVPDDPLVSPPGEFRFGDGGKSQLLDPGVWLAVADHYARAVPADASRLDAAGRRTARHTVLRAVAAVDEVLAFIPPASDAVPVSAFTSPTGRQVREREPGRFRRARLQVVRDTYRQIAAEMTEPPSGAAR